MNQNKFAPPAPSSGVCAKGGRRLSSLASAATQSTLDHEEYRSTDTALGRRWGMCRSTRALRTTGRSGGLGCHRGGCFIPAVDGYDCLLKNWPGLRSRRSLNLRGIEAGSIHLFAIDHSSHQSHFQCVSEANPTHFEVSVSVAFEPSDGASGSAPNHPGEVPQHRGERHVSAV